MKTFIALALVTLGVTVSARAQWIVYDPANTVQSVINTAQEIAKFVQMINNQVQQIQTLEDQLNEFKHYESLFGDPKAVVLSTVQPLVNDLRKTELGQTLTALEGAVDAGEACSTTPTACSPASARRSHGIKLRRHYRNAVQRLRAGAKTRNRCLETSRQHKRACITSA
jgi:conjugal transfer/entry exclusion protein